MTSGDQILTGIITRLAQDDPSWGRFFKRQPAYRYFTIKGSNNQPFWTTEPLNHNGHKRFASGIYKYIKSKNMFRLTNAKYHTKRKDAKERALKLYYQLTTKKEQK